MKQQAITIFITLWCLIFIAGCEPEPISTEPVRPAQVSADSAWVGGLDGGVFVLVSPTDIQAGIYNAEIYYVSGDLAYKGSMKLSPADAMFDPVRKSDYEGWDGDTLYLSHGRTLSVMD